MMQQQQQSYSSPVRGRSRNTPFQQRRFCVLPLFLLFSALFSLPGLLLALVIRQIVERALDYWECRCWLYAGAMLGVVFYLSWMVLAVPFPGMITSTITDVLLGQWRDAAIQLVFLWFTNMWLAPLFVFILAALAPLRASEPLPKEEPRMPIREAIKENDEYASQEVFHYFESEEVRGASFLEKGEMKTPMPTQRFFLLFLGSWVLELFGGAVFLRWYWGVAWLGGKESLAQLVSDVLMIWKVTPAGIILFVLGLYLLIHVAYAVWSGVLGPLMIRWKLGVRAPSHREQERMRDALRVLTGGTNRSVLIPRNWGIAEGQGMQMRWIGYMLVIDRELINHRYFFPLLAHELYACNSEIRMARRLYEMLPKVQVTLGTFGGFPFAIGNALLYVFWMRYWHQCIFDADEYACNLGQGYALTQALDELYLKLDQATPGGRKLKKTPYIEERIDRLRGRLGI
jgi:hypothetical protein